MILDLFLPWVKLQYSPSSKSSIKGGPGMSFDVLAVIPLGLSFLGKKNLIRISDCKLNIGEAPGRRYVPRADSSKRSQL